MSARTLERERTFGMPTLIGVARPRVITADIGASWTRIALGGERIDPKDIIKYPTPQNYDRMVIELGNKAVSLTDGRKIDAFGFGIAGQITNGVITQAGMLKEYGFVGKSVVADASDVMGISDANTVGTNDVRAASKAEQTARLARPSGADMKTVAMYTVSTGLAGAIITAEGITPDEAGHHFLKEGAFCGCGQEGCFEAHASGSGIEKKFGVRGENIPADSNIWNEVRGDFVDGMDLTLNRYAAEGVHPSTLVFYGSVALGAPHMLDSLESGLLYRRGADTPDIEVATYGNDSGLYGSYFDALETL